MNINSKLSSKSEKQIQFNMQQAGIFKQNLKNTQFFINFKRFMHQHIFLQHSSLELKDRISLQKIIQILEKSFNLAWERKWTQLFAIHTITHQIFIFQQKSKIVYQSLLKQIQMITKPMQIKAQMKSTDSFLKRSISKFKSALKNKKKGIQNENEQRKQTQKSINKTQLLIQIQTQYANYLKKLLTDCIALAESQIELQSRNYLCKIQQDPLKFHNLVWKMFNLLGRSNSINKKCFKLGNYFPQYNKYNYSTMNFLSQDFSIFYSPIIDYIKFKKEELLKGYESLQTSLKLQNNSLFKQKLLSFGESENFIGFKTMIEEFGKLNQVGVEIYCSPHHSKYLVKGKRPHKFISLNSVQFDKLYKLFKLIDQYKVKNEHEDYCLTSRINIFTERSNTSRNVKNYKMARINFQANCLKSKQSIRQTNYTQTSEYLTIK